MDMKLKRTTVSRTQSIDLKSLSKSLSFGISPSRCLPLPLGSMEFAIEVFQWHIDNKATLSGGM
jgi:hypothetical protein